MQQMIITNPTIDKKIGRWEYDIKNDIILLNDGASIIYYNESGEKRIKIEDFFRILSPKSSQDLAETLTNGKSGETIFLQRICCMDGQTKKVLIMMLNGTGISDNKYGICADVTKIL